MLPKIEALGFISEKNRSLFFKLNVPFKSKVCSKRTPPITDKILKFRCHEYQIRLYHRNRRNTVRTKGKIKPASTSKLNEGFSIFEIIDPKLKEVNEGRRIYVEVQGKIH